MCKYIAQGGVGGGAFPGAGPSHPGSLQVSAAGQVWGLDPGGSVPSMISGSFVPPCEHGGGGGGAGRSWLLCESKARAAVSVGRF